MQKSTTALLPDVLGIWPSISEGTEAPLNLLLTSGRAAATNDSRYTTHSFTRVQNPWKIYGFMTSEEVLTTYIIAYEGGVYVRHRSAVSLNHGSPLCTYSASRS